MSHIVASQVIAVSVSALLLALSISPAAAQPNTPPAQQAAAGETGKADRDSANARLLAAAEPFETLTEQSFSAKSAQREKLVAQAEQAAGSVADLLPGPSQSELNTRIAAIKQSQQQNHSADLARASIEVYRLLVSAAHPTKVPTAVNLLDYSGFRYDAGLKSHPPRWEDMQATVDYAKEQWNSISGRVSDTTLKNAFDTVIHEMEAAVANKSLQHAKTAVATELNLVDSLEKHFARA